MHDELAEYVYMEIPSNLVSVGYTMSKDFCKSNCFSLAPVCFPGSRLIKRTDTSLNSDSQFTSWPWSIYRYRNVLCMSMLFVE